MDRRIDSINKIKLSKKYQALIFFLAGFAVCSIIILIKQAGAFTTEIKGSILIIVLVIYTAGLVSAFYGIYIASDIYGKWLNEDYGKNIYEEIIAKK